MKKIFGILLSVIMLSTLSACSGNSIDDEAITALQKALNGKGLQFTYTEYEISAEIEGRMIQNKDLEDVNGKLSVTGEMFANKKEDKVQAIFNISISEAQSFLGINNLETKMYLDGEKMYMEMLGQKQMQIMSEEDLASFDAFLYATDGTSSGKKVTDKNMESLKEQLSGASLEKDGDTTKIILEFDDEAFAKISDANKVDFVDCVVTVILKDNNITGIEAEFTMAPQDDNGEELTIKLLFNTKNHDKKQSITFPDLSAFTQTNPGTYQ